MRPSRAAQQECYLSCGLRFVPSSLKGTLCTDVPGADLDRTVRQLADRRACLHTVESAKPVIRRVLRAQDCGTVHEVSLGKPMQELVWLHRPMSLACCLPIGRRPCRADFFSILASERSVTGGSSRFARWLDGRIWRAYAGVQDDSCTDMKLWITGKHEGVRVVESRRWGEA